MEPMTQLTYPIAPLPQLVFPYFHYHPISPPYEPLDLSKKRSPSPCYAYPYPSPNPSPTYMPVLSPSAEYMLSPKPSPNGLLITSPVSERRIPNSVVDPEPCERSSSSYSDSSTSPSSKVSGTRPFKAFPKDPLRLSLGVGAATSEPSNIILRETLSENGDSEMTKALIDDSVKAYSEFRQKMMEKISHENGTNTNMRRTQHQNDKICDEEYLRKRRKNNEAAKKSRDARRQKQDEIAIRVTFLEQENMMLRYKVAAAEAELEQLEKLKLPM